MATLDILVYPDRRLKQVAREVGAGEFDDSLRRLVADMAETMYAACGIGLAAVQVGVGRRVVVMDLSDARDELQVFVNPRLTATAGRAESEEGCLSVPEVRAKVTRAATLTLCAMDAHGKRLEVDADGLFAACIQHEIDHLDGIVFVDRLSRMKRERIRKRFLKEMRGGDDRPALAAGGDGDTGRPALAANGNGGVDRSALAASGDGDIGRTVNATATRPAHLAIPRPADSPDEAAA